MNRRIRTLLLFIVTALLLFYELTVVRRSEPTPAGEAAPARSVGVTRTYRGERPRGDSASPETLGIIAGRNVFATAAQVERPHSDELSTQSELRQVSDTRNVKLIPLFELTGVAVSSSGSGVATILVNGEMRLMAVGDSVAGFLLERLTTRGVRLVRSDTALVMTLR